jgi:glucose/arabinose dehydrogenase
MKLGIIAASMLIGAASLVSVSAHAQTSQTLVVPKSAVPQAGRVSPDKPKPTALRFSSEPSTSASTDAPMAARVDPGK